MQNKPSLAIRWFTSLTSFAVLLGAALPGAAQTWSGVTTGGPVTWNATGNWTPATIPNSSSAAAMFNSSFTTNASSGNQEQFTLDAGITVNSISYQDTSTKHYAATIAAGTSGTLTFAGTTPTVDTPNATAETLTISAPTTATSGLTKGTGVGKVVFSGAVTGGSTFEVKGGTLNFSGGVSGFTSGTVDSGADLQIQTTTTLPPLTLNAATGNTTAYSLEFPNGNTTTYTLGTIGLSGDVIIRVFGLVNTFTLGGAISSSGQNSLTFRTEGGNSETQPHTFNWNTAASYTGNTALNAVSQTGVLKLGANNVLPSTTTLSLNGGGNVLCSANLDLNGKTLTLAGLSGTPGTGGAKLFNSVSGTTAALTINSSSPSTFSGLLGSLFNQNITGANYANVSLNVQGSSTFKLSGANPYYGGTTVSSGATLQVGSTKSLGNYGAMSGTSVGSTTVSAGGTLDLNGTTPINAPITLNGTGVASAGALINSSGTLVTIDSGLAGLAYTTGNGIFTNTATATFSGGGGSGTVVTPNFGVSSASFTVTGGGSYTTKPTGVNVTGGTAAAVNVTYSASSPYSITAISVTVPGYGFGATTPGITLTGGAGTAATITGNTNNFAINNLAVTTPGTGYTTAPSFSFSAPNSGATLTPGAVTISSVALGSDSSIGGSGNITINPAITGAHALTKVGANTLTLNGANTFSGNTTISAGTLALGASGSLPSASSVSIAAGATVDVSAVTGTSGTYTWGGSSGLTATGSATSGTANAAQLTAGSSAIVDVTGRPVTLTFTPGSTSGTVSTYPALNVAAGTLNLDSTTTFTINNNGAALDAGDYTLISGNVTGTPTSSTVLVGGTGMVSGGVATLSNSGNNLVMHVAIAAVTTTTIALNNPWTSSSTYGDALSFHVTVSGSGPTGTIAIKDGGVSGTTIGTGTLSGGAVDITLSPLNSLVVGAHANIVAVYAGDSGNAASTSGALGTQTVGQKTLTLTGGTANKLYDGTTSAIITGGSLSALVSGDSGITATTGTFANPGSATTNTLGETVTIILSGTGAGNYSVTPATLTADILQKVAWNNGTADNKWTTGGNWQDSLVASGSLIGADFSTLDITADTTVHLDASETNNSLTFGNTDATPTANWIVDNNGTSGNTLTLAGTTPTITVNNLGTGKSATISATVTGTTGITKAGAGTLLLSGADTDTGTVTVNAGELDIANFAAASTGVWSVGTTAGVTGTLGITGGTVPLGGSTFYVGAANTAVAVVNQSGGTVNLNSGSVNILLGNSQSSCTYNLSGGTINVTGGATASRGVMLGVNSTTTGNTATFNLSGTGNLNMPANELAVGRDDGAVTNWTTAFYQTGSSTATIGYLSIGGQAGAKYTTAIFSLTGGTFMATNFQHLVAAATSSGTLTLGGSAQVKLPAFPTPAGTANLTFDFTTGYLSPYAASTTYLQGLTHCYLTANGANFNVGSGNDITVAQAMQDVTSGGTLTKSGIGILTLSGANTYSGVTTVSNGTLLVNGSLAGGVVVAPGGTLGGGGTIAGATTVNAGGLLSPGTNGMGTLSFSGNLTLNAASTNNFAVTSTGGASNMVAVTSQLTPNGSVIHITSGTALNPSTNTLFTYGSISGAFNPTPVFDVAPNGTASIVNTGSGSVKLVVATASSYASNPTNISFTVTGNSLNLGWPLDHKGWLVQSNSLNLAVSTDWVDISNTATGTNYSITLDPTQTNVFYRLRKP